MMTPEVGRPPSYVTAALALCTKLKKNSPRGCFLTLDTYI